MKNPFIKSNGFLVFIIFFLYYEKGNDSKSDHIRVERFCNEDIRTANVLQFRIVGKISFQKQNVNEIYQPEKDDNRNHAQNNHHLVLPSHDCIQTKYIVGNDNERNQQNESQNEGESG
jgi:hypothetical protein